MLVSNQEEVTQLRGFRGAAFFVEPDKETVNQTKQAPKRKQKANSETKLTESTVRDLLEKAITKTKDKMIKSGVDLSVTELCKLLQMLKEYEDEDTPAEIEVKWVDPGASSKET